jgi:3-isopropylmalate/(R)-2-methylmalate dehydratase large subunit
MAVEVEGRLGPGVSAKDLILHIIAELGVAGGVSYALEYRGQAVRALTVEERLTLANMAIECGARMGLIAPDETTLAYIRGLPLAPSGADFEAAAAWWRTLFTDPGFEFDRRVTIDAGRVEPLATWGANPAQSAPLTGRVPAPDDFSDAADRMAAAKALEYQGLEPGRLMSDIPVDYVFIGSCTNGRLEDLRAAAAVLKGRRAAPGVTVLVVPGSGPVKARAESEGLADIFRAAGCQWREPGCSMCLGKNPDQVPPGRRCASTSNRNFEGRQGKGARTHLVSPAAAAAAAVKGRLTDPREL